MAWALAPCWVSGRASQFSIQAKGVLACLEVSKLLISGARLLLVPGLSSENGARMSVSPVSCTLLRLFKNECTLLFEVLTVMISEGLRQGLFEFPLSMNNI